MLVFTINTNAQFSDYYDMHDDVEEKNLVLASLKIKNAIFNFQGQNILI